MSLRPRRPIEAYGFIAGATPRYCHDCKTPKPMDPSSRRCLECATVHKELDDSRLMPRPFFDGATHNFSVEHVTGGAWRSERRRPLAEGERVLGWLILPPFQRPPVWSQAQREKLIESMWLDLPIGAYVYNDAPTYQHPTDCWLIDGQQRITALLAYVADEFEVFGYRWSQLTNLDRGAFNLRPFPAIKLSMEDPARLREVYDRLAYGGTPHERTTRDGCNGHLFSEDVWNH